MKRISVIGIAPYVVILLISSYLYYQALQIAAGSEGHLGPAFWPKTILVFAIFTCVWEITRRICVRAPRGDRLGSVDASSGHTSLIPQRKALEDVPDVGPFVSWIGIGITAAYVLSFPWLGYFIATFLYVTAFVFFGNYRRPLVAACVGIAASLVFMFVFMRVVYVSLPIGAEPFAQVSTFLMRVMGIK